MGHELENDILDILVSKEEAQQYTRETADKLTKDYRGGCPLLVGILKGTCPSLCDLMQAMPTGISPDFMSVSSYGASSSSTGEVRILESLDTSVQDREVIIVEDIIDSGNTLFYLKSPLLSREAKSVELMTLLDKPDRRTRSIEVKRIGKSIPGHFVVGYGLDFDEAYRNPPYIGISKPEVYS